MHALRRSVFSPPPHPLGSTKNQQRCETLRVAATSDRSASKRNFRPAVVSSFSRALLCKLTRKLSVSGRSDLLTEIFHFPSSIRRTPLLNSSRGGAHHLANAKRLNSAVSLSRGIATSHRGQCIAGLLRFQRTRSRSPFSGDFPRAGSPWPGHVSRCQGHDPRATCRLDWSGETEILHASARTAGERSAGAVNRQPH